MDDWYLPETKNYETFAAKYPMNGELTAQQEKIQVMNNWCDAMKIRATPTIYVNGSELPESYRVADLKIFLDVEKCPSRFETISGKQKVPCKRPSQAIRE